MDPPDRKCIIIITLPVSSPSPSWCKAHAGRVQDAVGSTCPHVTLVLNGQCCACAPGDMTDLVLGAMGCHLVCACSSVNSASSPHVAGLASQSFGIRGAGPSHTCCQNAGHAIRPDKGQFVRHDVESM